MPEMSDIVFDLAPTAPHRLTDPETTFAPAADLFADHIHALGPELNTKLPLLIELAGLVKPSGQSTTSMAISTGTKTGIAAGAGKTVVPGAPIRFTSAADPAIDWMEGTVTAYSFATGTMDVEIERYNPGASGTHTDWFWTVTGPQGSPGDEFPSVGPAQAKFLVRANAAGDAFELGDTAPQTIQTYSPAAVANYSITGLLASAALLGFNDLIIEYDLTQSVSGGIYIQTSPDGSSYVGGPNAGAASGTVHKGVAVFRGFRNRRGIGFAAGSTGSAPTSLSATPNSGNGWMFATGLDALRFAASTGTLSGTIILKASI